MPLPSQREVKLVGAGKCCAAVGTQWGPVRAPAPPQRPVTWDIGLLSGTGRTTAAAAGGSELTGLPLPQSLRRSVASPWGHCALALLCAPIP